MDRRGAGVDVFAVGGGHNRSYICSADTTRLAQRREAWRRFAETLASVPVFAALDAPDLAATRRALQAAMSAPVR